MNSNAILVFRRLVFCSFLLLTLVFVKAQKHLEIMGANNDYHLMHTVAAKESWYSIGRLYNVSPKELAHYNKLSLEAPLAIGKMVKIPLTAVNFSLDGSKVDDESLIPLYHKVKEKEWMFRIATNVGITVAQLEKQNNIKSDQLKSGMSLIVAYLKVKKSLSPLAQVLEEGHADKSIKPAAETIKIQTPTVTAKDTVVAIQNNVVKVDIAESKQPTAAVSSKPVEQLKVDPSMVADFQGGAFKKQFSGGSQQLKGNAGIFKSTSGWNDGKYYALVNEVPVGTIIRITFSLTGKEVFAKVLGALPDMKESQGLVIRISDAAASELGVVSTKFYVDVAY